MAADHLASLIFCVGLEARQAQIQLSSPPHWPVHSNKSKASLCQSKYQLSSTSLPSI